MDGCETRCIACAFGLWHALKPLSEWQIRGDGASLVKMDHLHFYNGMPAARFEVAFIYLCFDRSRMHASKFGPVDAHQRLVYVDKSV